MTSARRTGGARPRRRLSAIGGGALAIFATLSGTASTPARAESAPSCWDRARDPAIAESYDLHLRVRALIDLDAAAKAGSSTGGMKTIALERARTLLESADAAHSPDVRLRFDLGEVYEQAHRHEQAAEILEAAVAMAPHHPMVVEALESLSYAYAYLDRSREERATYHRFIPLVTDDLTKAVAMLNLAEAEMHLGNMEDAVAGYRDTIALAGQIPNSMSAGRTGTLAVWGYAVALDRAGDPQGAMQQATLATEIDRGEQLIGGGKEVFFVPAYERDWYLALAAMVHAKGAASPREALVEWTRAVDLWTHYVTSADPAGREAAAPGAPPRAPTTATGHTQEAPDAPDHWVPLARSHLARCRAERAKAEKRVASLPPPAEPDTRVHEIQ